VDAAVRGSASTQHNADVGRGVGGKGVGGGGGGGGGAEKHCEGLKAVAVSGCDVAATVANSGGVDVFPEQVEVVSNNALSLRCTFFVREYADSLSKRKASAGGSVRYLTCIELDGGRRVTPTAMEKEAGMEKSKKWKNSLLAVHLGKQLKMDKFLGMFGLS
jgi:hypothetical protein